MGNFDIFDVLTLIGGLCLFIFGMNVMGQALERRAGGSLQGILSKLTSNKFAGFLTGLGVTAVIQSSSATTVMVVGFVNSGLLTLRQAISVIMGANVGTTVTAWVLSLGGLSGEALIVKLLKPMSFTPVLGLIGIVFYMFCKSNKKKDTGTILLGFAVLMYGMDIMTDSVSGLKDIPQFQNLFIMFKNPLLGVAAGAILTAIIQSSSASVGILQALARTGQVSYGAAIPIIMGQNIGTCITAILSSFGTNKNAKRTALVHLSFNIIGTAVWLIVFSIIKVTLAPALFDEAASMAGVAIAHSIFNIACTALLLPMSSLLEKLAYKLVPETEKKDKVSELDERLLATPSVALERCHSLACEMGGCARESIVLSVGALGEYSEETLEEVRDIEEKTDHYEDIIGSYLVKLSSAQLSDYESAEAAKLLKIIGDFERIGDHSMNIAQSARELYDKQISLTAPAKAELLKLTDAVNEIMNLTCRAFSENDIESASRVEPLEEVIDRIREDLRTSHIRRLQQGNCSIEGGFVWSDLLTNLERISDHCSNIAACVIDSADIDLHRSVREMKSDNPKYKESYKHYADRYLNA